MRLPRTIRLLQRFRRDARGVTIVEFGFIAPVLTLFIMGTTELGLIGGAQKLLDDAVFIGSRTGKTGYKEANKTQAQTIEDAVKKAASVLLNKNNITITSTAFTDYSYIKPESFTDKNKNGKWDSGEAYVDANGNGKYDDGVGTSGAGSSSQIVTYQVRYDWRLFTPGISRLIGKNGVVTLKSSIVVKNEPY